ncbi:hypothetical protein BDZ89DRAFT_53665 [Hymenopellis radicata]|nr:hypothetical protein BDZ89DRAFT_53665 [Hymenopellis radicata]
MSEISRKSLSLLLGLLIPTIKAQTVMQRHLVGVSFLFDPPHFRHSSCYCSSRYLLTRFMPSDNSTLENLAMSRGQERLH